MKTRIRIPKMTEKEIFQESLSACTFCRETEVASLQIHHVDEDPSNNNSDNLLLVCANCHGKITQGKISQADASVQKQKAKYKFLDAIPKKDVRVEVNVSGGSFKGDVAQTINKFTTKGNPKITHPPGSIGANLQLRGYVDYMIARYFQYKKADSSYGSKAVFSHAVIHKNIQRKFGTKTFFTPEERFDELCSYLKLSIDKTIQGKRNNSKGHKNYHTYEEHYK